MLTPSGDFTSPEFTKVSRRLPSILTYMRRAGFGKYHSTHLNFYTVLVIMGSSTTSSRS